MFKHAVLGMDAGSLVSLKRLWFIPDDVPNAVYEWLQRRYRVAVIHRIVSSITLEFGVEF